MIISVFVSVLVSVVFVLGGFHGWFTPVAAAILAAGASFCLIYRKDTWFLLADLFSAGFDSARENLLSCVLWLIAGLVAVGVSAVFPRFGLSVLAAVIVFACSYKTGVLMSSDHLRRKVRKDRENVPSSLVLARRIVFRINNRGLPSSYPALVLLAVLSPIVMLAESVEFLLGIFDHNDDLGTVCGSTIGAFCATLCGVYLGWGLVGAIPVALVVPGILDELSSALWSEKEGCQLL